jgi:hypothetical protein
MSFTMFVDRSDRSERRGGISEFWTGALSGLLCTLVGFGFTILWDNQKYSRDVDQRDAAVIGVLRQETSENLELTTKDQEIISDEFDSLKNSNTLIRPLVLLKVGAWDLIRVGIPKKLTDQNQILK